jgi:hypothetical protein
MMPVFTYIPDNQVISVGIVTALEQVILCAACNDAYYSADPSINRKNIPQRPSDPYQYQYKHVYCNAVYPGSRPTAALTQVLDRDGKLVYNQQHDQSWKCWGCGFAAANEL